MLEKCVRIFWCLIVAAKTEWKNIGEEQGNTGRKWRENFSNSEVTL